MQTNDLNLADGIASLVHLSVEQLVQLGDDSKVDSHE